MKSSSTVRNTCRGSQSYMEKRRGRREIEVTRSRRGGIKRGESKIASNHLPMCSPQSGPLGEVHGVTKRSRWREVEVTREERGVKRGETNLASNQLPKCSPQPGTPREFHRVKQRREGERRR